MSIKQDMPTSGYEQVTTLTIQGTTVVLARELPDSTGSKASDNPNPGAISFNVLSSAARHSPTAPVWVGFKPLRFPDEVRPAGMEIVNVFSKYEDGTTLTPLTDAGCGFRAVPHGEYVYIFRQTVKGTLLSTRFRLIREGSTSTPDRVSYSLEPVWEVRFEMSEKPDTPANDQDAPSYLSLDKSPFLEPTIDLSMVQNLSEGAFDVIITPAPGGRALCHIFQQISSNNKIKVFSLPLDESGRFDLRGIPLDKNGISPAMEFTVALKDKTEIELFGAPSGKLYLKQESVTNRQQSFYIKRTGRVMLACSARIKSGGTTLVTLDFGIHTSGTLTALPDTVTADGIGPAPYTGVFNRTTYLSFAPVSLREPFRCTMQLKPEAVKDSRSTIIKNRTGDKSFWISLLDSGLLEIGIGTGKNQSVYTSKKSIREGTWSMLDIRWDPTSEKPCQLFVNNENIDMSGSLKGSPAGVIDSIGATENGYTGQLDNFFIYKGTNPEKATVLIGLPLDTIDYRTAQPTTPDTAEGAKPAQVFGVYLVASTSPLATSNIGTPYQVGMLTAYAAYFKDFQTFGELSSSPRLHEGGDGLLHCYFEGKDSLFSVMQFDTRTARAMFQSEWKTVTGAPESGNLFYMVSKSGAALNATIITISNSTTDHFCVLSISSPDGQREQWDGIPRTLSGFTATVNGASVCDPTDPRLLNSDVSFFDPQGIYHAAYLPINASTSTAQLSFVDRYPESLTLSKVSITDRKPLFDITIEFSVPKWKSTATQKWSNLPSSVSHLISILSGNASEYDYSASGFSLISYSLKTEALQPPESRVVVFINPLVKNLQTLTVTPVDAPQLCKVTIKLVIGKNPPLQATWNLVPRDQTTFAAILEGTDAHYNYTGNATGNFKEISQHLLIITDGISASVADMVKTPKPDSGMLAGTSIFSAFPTETITENDKLRPAIGSAATFQKAVFTEGMIKTALLTGSTLLRTFVSEGPTTGGTAWIQNTSALTDNKAALTLQGVNGGWIQEPNRRTLSYTADDKNRNFVEFSVASDKAPNIDTLTIPGDMTLEMWCRPKAWSENTFGSRQRMLTFSRPQSPDSGMMNVQYLAGLRYCPSLICNNQTNARTSITNDGNGTTILWISPVKSSRTALAPIVSIATLGAVRPIISVALTTDNKLQLTCPIVEKSDPVVAARPLSDDTWYQVAYTLATEINKTPTGEYSYTFTCVLYLNGTQCGKQSYTYVNIDKLQLATFVLGDFMGNETLPMKVNEVAFISATMDIDEIEVYLERRIPDNLNSLLLKWAFIDGKGSVAVNSAASGNINNGSIKPEAQWAESGLFSLPVIGYGEQIAYLRDNPILPSWNHLAMVRQTGYALAIDGNQYADCGNDATLRVGESFSLEAWTKIDELRPEGQVIAAKGNDYRLFIGLDGYAAFELRMKIGTTIQSVSVKSSKAVKPGETCCFAVTYTTKNIIIDSDQQRQNACEIHLDLYQDGIIIGKQVGTGDLSNFTYNKFTDPVSTVSSDAPFNIGRSSLLDGSLYLKGSIADVRLWNRVLHAEEIASVAQTHRVPSDRNGLISWWHFENSRGKIVLDTVGSNHAKLSLGAQTILFAPTAILAVSLNGSVVPSFQYADGSGGVGGYGDTPQFFIGQVEGSGNLGYTGQIDEVRIWDRQRTASQISGDMNRSLVGCEESLAGYWRFDNGSGLSVEDATGRENTGTLCGTGSTLPLWVASTAPISNEAGPVYNILGGISTNLNRKVDGTPDVVEYADLDNDAYGKIFSVLKRLYAYRIGNRLILLTGYNVGELDTIFMGQAQASPSLIGFIEGAPPIPSENQTLPYWLDGPGAINSYGEATSIQFQEASSVNYIYNTDRSTADHHEFNVKAGLKIDGSWKTSVGLAAEVESPAFKLESKLGAQGHFEFGTTKNQNTNSQISTSRTFSSALRPGGMWEPGTTPEMWLNPNVGRRYSPNNTGYALVKSLTVDLYASILKSTGTMIAISSIPNRDIPADVNILDFPINPGYIRNGCLDGKVGLVNDPAFGDSDTKRGSYFRPVEAYALKRDIQRREKQLEADYLQYNTKSLSDSLSDETTWNDFRNSIRSGDTYDWAKHLSRRNLVNTYVWTAGGGRYAEEESSMNVYSENYGTVASDVNGVGGILELGMVFPVAGFFLEFDYLYTATTEVNVVRQKDESAGFTLSSVAEPDSCLLPPVIKDGNASYGEEPAEGKVDGYRYMSFFLAPNRDNFAAFKNIIDPKWYRSSQPNAVAIREATAADNGVWRILHRVTYVSRVPRKFQAIPDTSPTPLVNKPTAPDQNAAILSLIKSSITSDSPTPIEIGSAVSTLLGVPGKPGTIQNVLPWWSAFLDDSVNPLLPAARILRALREDLLSYVIAKYATDT